MNTNKALWEKGDFTRIASTMRTSGDALVDAYAAAESSGRNQDLHRELDALFNAQNRSGNPNATEIPATYLRVTVKR